MKMENRFGLNGMGESDIVYMNLYPNRWLFSIKIQDFETGDILRETQISQKYKYTKKKHNYL